MSKPSWLLPAAALALSFSCGVAAHAADSLAAAPAAALRPPVSPIIVDGRMRVDSPMPNQMAVPTRAAYQRIFTAIRYGRFVDALTELDRMPSSGLLTATARAQLWLAPGSPKPTAEALSAWLAVNSTLPEAGQVSALARQAGVTDLPILPQQQGLRAVHMSTREKPRSSRSDTASATAVAQMKQLLATDQPAAAEDVLKNASLDSETRTEWTQRIAWAWYLSGNDSRALLLASQSKSAIGEWAAMNNWVAGLAAFRSGDCLRAADHFARVASAAHSEDLAAAGHFWTARTDTACGRPERVSARLRTAARYDDSFYGLLARRVLGIEQPPAIPKPDFLLADWKHVDDLPGAKRAAALVEIGELGLADRELRFLARTGIAENHVALTYLAAKLNLPATQYWLSHNAPFGVTPPVSARYPAPEWVPSRGWRVDKSLVFAHALQESRFITDARSRVGARGIMQLMPGTARQIATTMTTASSDDQLADPSFNIEYGQTYLEQLRDSEWTGGLLPKVIAAYNAGPGSLKNWNGQLRDNNDPLLFIESIPFVETRHYVEVVLKNYWMYQQNEGASISSLDALAQGMWPRFPGLPGKSAIRLEPMRTTASAN